ncbi:uncharacterized protein TRAVEDRAFT_127839, partial [Trametes versicolor FP-101664 SS1]|uniref:uncharacterized protein n=1 Tax=Trametes versicolor (strain FP-101664) TaxID=717944 RepID=UPI0004623F8E
MIPLTRRNAARGASLVSYTRQSLPRPARLYSTPTKRLDAEAVPSPAGLSMEYPPFMPSSSSSIHNDMHGFLRRPAQYTILPTPLPADAADETHQHLFTDSPTQDRIAVMDACLHDLHDVPRAKEIFELLRES